MIVTNDNIPENLLTALLNSDWLQVLQSFPNTHLLGKYLYRT